MVTRPVRNPSALSMVKNNPLAVVVIRSNASLVLPVARTLPLTWS